MTTCQYLIIGGWNKRSSSEWHRHSRRNRARNQGAPRAERAHAQGQAAIDQSSAAVIGVPAKVRPARDGRKQMCRL
jgi:hypothetical protein